MRLSHPSPAAPRQGVILLVVVLMLTLFLVVGLAFVLYSESAASASRINREAQNPDVADVPPETLHSWALGQLIYDVTDDITGAPSAIRGHSLARTMWGWNYVPLSGSLQPDPTKTNSAFDPTFGSLANTTPFNGLGPLRSGVPFPPIVTLPGITEYNLVNYTWFAQSNSTGAYSSLDHFLRDPERIAYRTDSGSVPAANQPVKSYAGGFNAPYTYPDRTNMFLAAVQANNGQPKLLAQSFNSPGSAFGSFDPSNPNWTNSVGKYLTLRPRPADHSPAFPYPQDLGGDVKQLPGVPFYVTTTVNGQQVQTQVQNDSFWMDLNYPVQISRNGKKFKPLFAFLILDLDGRINLNTDGNLNAIITNNGVQSLAHASNQGLGPYEINVSKVLNADQTASALPAEWQKLYIGAVTSTFVAGRYGQDKTPGNASLGANNALADPYAPDPIVGESFRSLIFPLDVDAVDLAMNRQVTTKFTLPFANFASFPQFSTTGYDNYTFVATQPAQNPRLNHPLLSQKLRAFGDDQPFGDDNMYYLLGADYRKSYLYSLIPQNLGYDGSNATLAAMGLRNRQLITTRSFDLDFPGASPWVTSSAASKYQLTATTAIVNSTAGNYPTGQPMTTPPAAQISNQTPAAGDYSDYKPNDGRANLLSKVDLNRKLTPYNDKTGLFNGGLPVPAPVPPSALIPGLLAIHPEYRYYVATNDRQQFAQDIFNRLVQATGAASLGRVQAGTASQGELSAVRWLAQLAANIVDYVDDDDISTVFVWNPINPNNPNDPANFAPDQIAQRVVFGVEAPKLVVNEAYCELQNDPQDNTTEGTAGAARPYQYCFWLELLNPMSVANPPSAYKNLKANDPNSPPPERQDLNKASQDRLAVQMQRTSPTTKSTYPVYQVMIVNETGQNSSPPTWLSQPNNTDGSIGMTQAVVVQVTSYMPDFAALTTAPAGAPGPYPDYTFVQPNIGAFNIPTTAGGPPSNTGFYVMGPDSKHPFFQPQPGGGVALHPTINLQDQGNTPPMTSVPWGQPADNTGAPGTAKNALTYSAPGTISPSQNPATIEGARTHTVLLRRLACPNLDPNPINPQTKALVNPNMPYNPYVTVDYITGVPTNDAVQYISQKPIPANTPNNPDWVNAPKNPSMRYSIGRVQPYNAAVTKRQRSAAAPNPVQNTFFQHNSPTPPPPSSASTDTSNQPNGPTLDWPFDWLTFADRPLTNVTEVMNVPTTPPHLLTHAFGYNPTTKKRDLSNHLAPWTVQDARIYRALEYFTVGDRSPYPGTNGRVAGKVNLNTIFDPQTLDALMDAQTNSNFFTEQALLDVWQGNGVLKDPNNNSFLNRKQQLLALPGATLPDKPFMSLAAPVVAANADAQYPNGSGLPNTIAPYPLPAAAAGGPTTPGGTFTPQTWPPQGTPPQGTPASINYAPPPQGQQIPPFVMNELLTKVSGHTTARSNTFAVFLTVGFFEVIDDTSLPVKLGAELTTAGGKNIRHQMFSIVDRTNLAIDAGKALDPFTPDPTGRLRQAPTPPTFMSLGDAIPAGTGAPPAPNKAATPITVNIAGGLPTDYDGTSPVTFSPYQPAPNTPAPTYWPPSASGPTCQWMFLDMGATQEPVQVTVDQTGTKLQLLFPNGAKYSHPAGAMLCTYQPGNPGPQGPIDYGSPQYRAVVPYTYIIQ